MGAARRWIEKPGKTWRVLAIFRIYQLLTIVLLPVDPFLPKAFWTSPTILGQTKIGIWLIASQSWKKLASSWAKLLMTTYFRTSTPLTLAEDNVAPKQFGCQGYERLFHVNCPLSIYRHFYNHLYLLSFFPSY